MAPPITNAIMPIHVRIPPCGRDKPPTSHRGIRIATVPGTKMVKRSVLTIGQNLRGMSASDPRQPAQPYCKIITAEEHKDAASDSSRVDPNNSIHIAVQN